MAKYKVLKQERDDAVARAVEAERLSKIEEVRRLENEISQLKQELARAQQDKLDLEQKLKEVDYCFRAVHASFRELSSDINQAYKAAQIPMQICDTIPAVWQQEEEDDTQSQDPS